MCKQLNIGDFMTDTCSLLHGCLFFTANALARSLTRVADDCFRTTGLAPSHAFLLLVVNDRPGISQGDLARELKLAPSTITRFVDGLEGRDIITRTKTGKTVGLDLTYSGRALVPQLQVAWRRLYEGMGTSLGREAADSLAEHLDAAVTVLDGE